LQFTAQVSPHIDLKPTQIAQELKAIRSLQNLAASVITSVVHYRAAHHRLRLSTNKDWCILSFRFQNMNSPESENLSGVNRRNSTSTSSGGKSLDASVDCSSEVSPIEPPQCDDNDNIVQTTQFKFRKALGTRKGEVQAIRSKYPSKIPVIVERYDQEQSLPQLQKSEFLVPEELSMSQLVTVVRNRLHLSSTQAIFLMVSNRSIASLSRTVLEVYREYHDHDGFLYLTYASQEAFGSHNDT
jgi:microtubule-associated protein 1 light chain